MVQTMPNQQRFMTTQDFCMWLHGFFELSGKSELTKEQVKMVHDHLNLIFKQSMITTAGTSTQVSQAHQQTQGTIQGTLIDGMLITLTKQY